MPKFYLVVCKKPKELKNYYNKKLSITEFKKRFPTACTTVSGRLSQLKNFFPEAIDWHMLEEEE